MSFNPAILDLISGAGAAPAPEVPMTIADLGAWYDMSYGVTLDGSNNISNLLDKSGNGLDLEQSNTLNRPAFIAGSASGNINGLPVAHFNTGVKELQRANSSLFQNIAGWTIFSVFRFDSSSGTQGTIFAGSTNASPSFNRASMSLHTTNTQLRALWRRQDGDALANVVQGTMVDGTSYKGTARVRFGSTPTALVRVGGSTSTGTPASTGTTDNTVSLTIAMGCLNGSALLAIRAHIGEVIVYKRDLTDGELTTIEDYLAAKWGV